MFALNQGEVCTCPSRALISRRSTTSSRARDRAHEEAIKQGDPPRHRHTMIGRPGEQRPAREDPVLHRHRPEPRAPACHRRRARRPRRRPAGGYYVDADHLRGRQQDADLPGGDLRPGRVGHDVPADFDDASRSPTTRSTASARRVEPRHEHGVPHGPRHPGRPRVDELLPRLPAHAAFGGYSSPASAARRTMMLDHYQQTKNMLIGYDDERRTPSRARLRGRGCGPAAPGAARPADGPPVRRLRDGSSPMCYPAGEFQTGPSDVLLGTIDTATTVAPSRLRSDEQGCSGITHVTPTSPSTSWTAAAPAFSPRGSRPAAASSSAPSFHRRRALPEPPCARDPRRPSTSHLPRGELPPASPRASGRVASTTPSPGHAGSAGRDPVVGLIDVETLPVGQADDGSIGGAKPQDPTDEWRPRRVPSQYA